MAKYHINPETGVPGPCRATKQCRFEGQTDHFDSKEAAQAAYEAENASFTASHPTSAAMLEPFTKSVESAIGRLSSVRTNDGSYGGSSPQSRMKDSWEKTRYLANNYVDVKESWSDRRGFYLQMRDAVRSMRDELGERSWGGVRPEHRVLNERLGVLLEDLSDLTGPEGADKERRMGLFRA